MNDFDDRIRAALHARTDQITAGDLVPAMPPTASDLRTRRTTRWAAPLLAAAAVAAVAIGATIVATQPSANKHVPPGGTTNPPISSSTQSLLGPSSTANVSSSPGGTVQPCFFADASPCKVPAGYVWYVPLWPFANYAQAKQWATVDGPNGHSPWHSDAVATAQFFTNNYLGFKDVTAITSTKITADEAHIGVGYKDPNGLKRTSAVIHLVRYERTLGDTAAGWEVVGTDDTTFSLETPAYDSTVTSPVTMGGHITGTDENIHAWVRASDQLTPLANKCCAPAGGQNSPWHVSVSFKAYSGPITLVASTGGHLIEHERFAIQGVIARG